jgi:hypothetical protein
MGSFMRDFAGDKPQRRRFMKLPETSCREDRQAGTDKPQRRRRQKAGRNTW